MGLQPRVIKALKEAQEWFVHNPEILPIMWKPYCKARMAEIGLICHEDVQTHSGPPTDAIFVRVALPKGWTKRAESKPIESTLLDEKERPRALITFKDTFWAFPGSHFERYAFMEWFTRYQLITDVQTLPGCDTRIRCHVLDRETMALVFTGEWDQWGIGAPVETECREYLAREHPDWCDPVAYWT